MAAGYNNNYTNKGYINPYCYPSEYPPQYVWYPSSSFYLRQQQQQVITMREQYFQQQQREEEERRARQQQQEQEQILDQEIFSSLLWEQLQQRRRQREEEEEEEERLKLVQQQQQLHEGRFEEYYSWDKEAERPYSRFLSFLEYDDSFLTPWHWNPDDDDDHAPPAASTSGLKSYMKIEPGSYFANDHHVSKISKIITEPVPSDQLLGQNVSRTDEEQVRDESVDHKPSKINVDKQGSDDTLDDHSRIDVEEVSRGFFKRLDLINAKQAPDNSLDRNHSSSTIDVEEASHSFLERLDRNKVDPRKLRKHKRDLQGTTSN